MTCDAYPDAVSRLVGLMLEVIPALEATGEHVTLARDVKAAHAAVAWHRPVAVNLSDVLSVLEMVDANARVRAGEIQRAWNGPFVDSEVRRVIATLRNSGVQS